MPTISVRITEKEKRLLSRRGRISDSVRRAIRRYIEEMESEAILSKLERLQRENPIQTSPTEIVRLIREDRDR